MGQAKKRGDFETRKSQAILRHQEERDEYRRRQAEAVAEAHRLRQEWWDSLTPEQKEAEAAAFARREDERRAREHRRIPFGSLMALAAMAAMR